MIETNQQELPAGETFPVPEMYGNPRATFIF